MLFRKKNERRCDLCLYATATDDEDIIMCQKKGKRNYHDRCIRFTYDPCKRIPSRARALDARKYEEYDYSL